jgi:hypothetical protein
MRVAMPNVVWEMKGPSTGLIREPKLFVLQGRRTCLWWVAEEKAGGGRNEALVFAQVEAYKSTYFLGYSPEQMTADRLIDLGKSAWLEEVSGHLRQRANVSELKHFAISFLDESPLFEFIARSFEFHSPFDVSVIESNLQQRIASCIHPLTRKDL